MFQSVSVCGVLPAGAQRTGILAVLKCLFHGDDVQVRLCPAVLREMGQFVKPAESSCCGAPSNAPVGMFRCSSVRSGTSGTCASGQRRCTAGTGDTHAAAHPLPPPSANGAVTMKCRRVKCGNHMGLQHCIILHKQALCARSCDMRMPLDFLPLFIIRA